jgi:hypothetical protein
LTRDYGLIYCLFYEKVPHPSDAHFWTLRTVIHGSGDYFRYLSDYSQTRFRTRNRDRPLLILAVLFFLTGVQLLCFGLLAEILMRTYHESQKRPIYRVRTVVGDRDFQ